MRWRTDGLIGVGLIVLVAFLHAFTGFFEAAEKKVYDRVTPFGGRKAADQVVVLAIDDQSIANLGRWPWPRDVHAKVIDKLTQANAKTVAHTALFFEPQVDRGLEYLQQIRGLLSPSYQDDPLARRLEPVLERAEAALNTDLTLSESLSKSGKVILPALFDLGEALGRPDQVLPPYIAAHAIQPDAGIAPLTSRRAQVPIASLGGAAAAIGHLNVLPDGVDGTVRAEPLFIDHGGVWVPSLSLLVAAKSLNLDVRNIQRDSDGVFRLGGLKIPVDNNGLFYPQFYAEKDGRPAFVTDSFFDLYAGKISPGKYAGKIVLIGTTAAGVGEQLVTPISAVTSSAAYLAHTTSSLLLGHFFSAPDWAHFLSAVVFLMVVVYVWLVVPRVTGRQAAWMTLVFVLLLAAAEYALLAVNHIWLPLVLPSVALVVGYLGVITSRFLVTEAGKLKSDEESAETNRMMGLALQGQGQLDMAFDRFRRVPLSDAVMDNLLNLALDFERKRQFNKAEAVYQHMATFDPQFKDLQSKLKRVKSLSETVLLGGGSGGPGATVLLGDSGVEKPMLGRYQVEKELGKGAMGVVYLGKDPKIGRVVAIKTMALAREFEGDELDDARQRFFREAETAGRLQHQHIVTIFDAGEDHELAYIAMEFLKGKDLSDYTRAGHLLPVAQVVSIVARVADALDYAHQLNVVHRDIKPANVMYDAASDTVKVTDFGIARVTDASRTRTGMVLGTPSFMSPEQIAGKKVDGRSDLYSLGVMTFQLLTGTLPFRAESMAELMFKIANEPAPDVRAARADVPLGLALAVSKAMAKGLDMRYTRGSQMAEDLRRGGPSYQTPPASVVSDSSSFDETQPVSSGGFATTVVMSPSSERSE